LNTGPLETRFSSVTTTKSTGATYTPPPLARFVARQLAGLVRANSPDTRKRLVCVDPAVGDGELLLQLGNVLRGEGYAHLVLVGYEIDADAARSAAGRLTLAGFPDVDIRVSDFLSQGPLDADVLVANPPYVRTQILGTEQAQQLATEHDLTGRVDLYHAFVARISSVLHPGAVAGLITSNRFLSTRGGETVRRLLADHFSVKHVWDLGDTKLFEAAVLPAVTLMIRADSGANAGGLGSAGMTTVYSTSSPGEDPVAADCVTELLTRSGVFGVADGRTFEVRQGRISLDAEDGGVWRLENDQTRDWLQKVRSKTWKTFSEVGKIRVGIKTTADDVFIREEWDLPEGEPELLRPLVTHHIGQRWRSAEPVKRVLYPHTTVGKKRVTLRLDEYPRAGCYLQRHRARLEGREYVRKAKREWYEVWVPQDPRLWALPKLVFRDIVDTPQFWIEVHDYVVNGDCYWMVLDEGVDEDVLWLALGVANTRFIEEFYDQKFNNKLYAGRRRFITQYVKEFPLPDRDTESARAIVSDAREAFRLVGERGRDADSSLVALQERLEEHVRSAFGVEDGELAAKGAER
jgi:adenine-specific DNA-methyltransferase